MESNEQTELTSKTEHMTASGGGGLVVGESEQKEKRLMDMNSNVVIAEGRGVLGD